MVRHFGNTNETRKEHGTIEENGCGKFNDINDAALESLKELGITHVWLTGVLEQASATAYPDRPADFPALLKGRAGSPYAIRDYFDVCPDYAVDPSKRLDEFRALLDRMERHGLKAIIDFVPNHVARSYASDVRPELSFGKDDDTSHFFNPNNNFYYLGDLHHGGGPPLKLPTDDGPLPYPPESDHGKVTGNNCINWSPSRNDWYETIKLNYGHDFSVGPPCDDLHPLPDADTLLEKTPDTWQKMDAILSYWQNMGVEGFRVDMAHMIPMRYWQWQIRRCRKRNSSVFFMAEAYDSDPAKLTDGNVLDDLLAAGYDAVYDAPSYETIKHIIEHGKWANDIDEAANPFSPRFHSVLRYAENHDEVRIASLKEWAAAGMDIGRPVSAILFGLGRGPIMIYSGQETGEPAYGSEGFSGDDARTSIFDYWSLPTLTPWVNGHKYDGGKLTQKQKELRGFYARLLRLCAEPAFTRGEFYGLNYANRGNEQYGRLGGEHVSGHWLYSFLRQDKSSGQAFLVVVNLHPSETFHNVHVQIPEDAIKWLSWRKDTFNFTDRLGSATSAKSNKMELVGGGLPLGNIPPKATLYLAIE
ncbi:alpha-amylase [Oceaniferula spumae]|uniref:Alpha-amylase n=1 Tax=Oceaniferula spumae TaxID=2979115 RepID=A0AAT9FP00_9BACT